MRAILNAAGAINPLWKPTWKTIDPTEYSPRKHLRTYGPLPEGRLLAGIAGHSISFDYFGPPSPEEIAAGPVHRCDPRLRELTPGPIGRGAGSQVCRPEYSSDELQMKRA